MVVSPSVYQPTMKKIIKIDELAFGHFGGFGYWFSAQSGKVFEGSKSTKEVNFPKRISFLRDTTVVIGITMVAFFFIVIVIAIAKGILDADPNLTGLLNVGTEAKTHWAVWAITSALGFAGGVLYYFKRCTFNHW